MSTMQDIILDDTLAHMGEERFNGYLFHAFCRSGYCTFEKNGRKFRFEEGNCMIVPRRGDTVKHILESADFKADVIYVTQEFIEISTPQSNYGMKGHLALFENPIMKLLPPQQEICGRNFDAIKFRLAQTNHCFRHDALINAVQCMIIDFFDFHAVLYGVDKISSQQHQLMNQFVEMLERGDFRENRDIGYYADKLCVTPKYLSEVSKKVSGLPAAYWITRYASLDISRLLRDRSLSFTEISDMFDFSSLSHFSRYVQNNLGVKPSDFRE
ncbi:MAG: AraC family transcriptional regulator [Bacteroidaceae bacterium]|nr:AraC family transcriptional regulator [Bacteroidaceae bacterium]